jgi:hypothetical protein
VNRSEEPAGEPADAEQRVSLREMFAHLPASSPPPPGNALTPRRFDAHEGAALARARSRATGISPWVFVMATALSTTVASVVAVLITLGAVNQDPPGIATQDVPPRGAVPVAIPAPAIPVVVTAPTQAAPRQIGLRQIGSPDQPLQLEPRRPAPLSLQIEPQQGAGEPYIFTLAHAPAGTLLFGANRISSDTWFLPPGAASRLEIVVPEWSTSVYEIAMVLRRTNGLVAAQNTAWIAVPPPAGAAPATPPADETAAKEVTKDVTKDAKAAAKDMPKDMLPKDMLTKADRLIANGDIMGARALYQRAAELGSAPAALALGTTYDPNRLWSLGVLGLAGNKERARQWYLRASELGNAEANARLTALGF